MGSREDDVDTDTDTDTDMDTPMAVVENHLPSDEGKQWLRSSAGVMTHGDRTVVSLNRFCAIPIRTQYYSKDDISHCNHHNVVLCVPNFEALDRFSNG